MKPLKVLLAVFLGMLAFTASVSFLPPSLFAALPANLTDRFMAVFGDAGGGATYLRVQATTNAAGALPANLNDRWYNAFVDAGSGTTALNVVCTGCGSGTPGGATGAVQFNNAGAFGGDAKFLWDSANKSLAIGTLGSFLSGTPGIVLTGSDADPSDFSLESAVTPQVIFVWGHGGTIGSPTDSGFNGPILQFDFFGSDASNVRGAAAQMLVQVDGGTQASAVPGRFAFFTTNPAGSLLERLRIDSAGLVHDAGPLQIGGTLGAPLTLTAGALGMTKITASASAPGASGAKFEVVCGTNAGTAKLIMVAGTSATAVTIVDNVGTGVTGC